MPVLPNVFCCKSNHHDRHDYQRGYLHPKIIGKAAFVFELGIHVDHLALKRTTRQRRKTNYRAALLLPRLPSLSPRIVGSCRCVVQEARLLSEWPYKSASACNNLGSQVSERHRHPSGHVNATRHDGIDLYQRSAGSRRISPSCRSFCRAETLISSK
jgi:hypothetical protein